MRFVAQHRSGQVLSITSSPDDAPSALVSSVMGAEITAVDVEKEMFDPSRIQSEDVAKLLGELRVERRAKISRAEN